MNKISEIREGSKIFEYNVLEYNELPTTEELNMLGTLGWEFCHMYISSENKNVIVWKREYEIN
jgi:hypothetical protein